MVPESMSGLREIKTPGDEGDARPMGEAVREAGNVVLPTALFEGRVELPLIQWQLKALDDRAAATDFGFVNLNEGGDQFVGRVTPAPLAGDTCTACAKCQLADRAGQGPSQGSETARDGRNKWHGSVPNKAMKSAPARARVPATTGSIPVVQRHREPGGVRPGRPTSARRRGRPNCPRTMS